jgi:hypothetical protein
MLNREVLYAMYHKVYEGHVVSVKVWSGRTVATLSTSSSPYLQCQVGCGGPPERMYLKVK